MSTTKPSRDPKGIPTGGQFAAKSSPESEVGLTDPDAWLKDEPPAPSFDFAGEGFDFYKTLPLPDLRRRQDICNQQSRTAFEQKNIQGFVNLQEMGIALAAAVDHVAFGPDSEAEPSAPPQEDPEPGTAFAYNPDKAGSEAYQRARHAGATHGEVMVSTLAGIPETRYAMYREHGASHEEAMDADVLDHEMIWFNRGPDDRDRVDGILSAMEIGKVMREAQAEAADLWRWESTPDEVRREVRDWKAGRLDDCDLSTEAIDKIEELAPELSLDSEIGEWIIGGDIRDESDPRHKLNLRDPITGAA